MANAALAAETASELLRLKQRIKDVEDSAALWGEKAAAAQSGSPTEEKYLKAYNELNAQLVSLYAQELELQKQKGVLLQREAGQDVQALAALQASQATLQARLQDVEAELQSGEPGTGGLLNHDVVRLPDQLRMLHVSGKEGEDHRPL